MGQYGANGRNREGGRGRIASGLATTDERAIARAFGTTAKPSETVMLLTEAFPIRGTSPAEPKPYFDRESGRRTADRERSEKRSDRERSEKRSDRAKC